MRGVLPVPAHFDASITPCIACSHARPSACLQSYFGGERTLQIVTYSLPVVLHKDEDTGRWSGSWIDDDVLARTPQSIADSIRTVWVVRCVALRCVALGQRGRSHTICSPPETQLRSPLGSVDVTGCPPAGLRDVRLHRHAHAAAQEAAGEHRCRCRCQWRAADGDVCALPAAVSPVSQWRRRVAVALISRWGRRRRQWQHAGHAAAGIRHERPQRLILRRLQRHWHGARWSHDIK